MPLKTVLASRYERLKNGIKSHESELPTELVKLLELPQLLTTGDKFLAEYAKESSAKAVVNPLRDDRRRESLELKVQYNMVKNLTEAFIGERNDARLKVFITTGRKSYLERAIFLRNALRNDTTTLTQVGEQHLEELERAIHEYQEAVGKENTAEESLSTADEQTDSLLYPLARLVTKAKLYLKAWAYDIDRPELYAEFVVPRAKSKGAAAAQDSNAVDTVAG